MGIETEGAINRLTAATMALATTIEASDEETSERDARGDVENRFEDHLDFLMER